MKLKPINPLKSGWSRWQFPTMKQYFMGCCDCGLVHELEFKIIKQVSKPQKNGWWKGKEIESDVYRVAMRAKRYDKKESK